MKQLDNVTKGIILLLLIAVGILGLSHYRQMNQEVNSQDELVKPNLEYAAEQAIDIGLHFQRIATKQYSVKALTPEDYANIMHNLVVAYLSCVKAIETGDERFYDAAKSILIDTEEILQTVARNYTET